MKCKNCGNEVDDGAKFCPNCGYKLDNLCPKCLAPVSPNDKYCTNCGFKLKDRIEEPTKDYYEPISDNNQYDYYQPIDHNNEPKVKEKVNWKRIIIALVVLISLTITGWYYIENNTDSVRNKVLGEGSNSSTDTNKNITVSGTNDNITNIGNINNEGKVLLVDDYIYMPGENGYLTKYDKSFNNKGVVLKESVTYLVSYNDYIYFADSNNYLSRINIKESNASKQIMLNKKVYYLNVRGNILYYQLDEDSESLYSMSLKDHKATKINDSRTYCPNITDDYIYYNSSDGIYRMDKDGKNDTKLIDGKIYNLLYDDNKLYYIDSSYKLNIYNLSNKSTNQVESLNMSTYNKIGNTIYAYTNSGLASYDLTKDSSKTLYNGVCDSIWIVGDTVIAYTDSGYIAVDKDGNSKTIVQASTNDNSQDNNQDNNQNDDNDSIYV